ncbi:hypothetical protein CPB83DRAFT_903660 [Crepidotus variabilis]|uniref:F-box domain-containing protein n=1 Tax=Crepidotus variabilis TaxID=179855 RepID=A0A9P6EPD0_9AGAR|nr:hypothetical protein CPB83DRAFT_903660 [Crepidotus variabilis]
MEEEKINASMLLETSNPSQGTTAGQPSMAKVLAQHRAVLSPVQKLPDEILQEIFVRVNDRVSFPRQPWLMRPSKVPWALALVCRRWRSAALSVSVLWSRLPSMTLSMEDMPREIQADLERLEMLLQRSQPAPLKFQCVLFDFSKDAHPALKLLIRHCERWWDVKFVMETRRILHFEEIKGRLHKLDSLALQMVGDQEGISAIDIFKDAPQLRRVDISGDFNAELVFPFGQLKYYKDDLRSKNILSRVATSAHSLETLVFHIDRLELNTMPLDFAITLPSLRNLQVNLKGLIPPFLKNISVPAIEEFTISTNAMEGTLIPLVINMISNSPRSSCSLKSLRIRAPTPLIGELVNLLSLTPQLTSFNLSTYTFPPVHDINTLATQLSLVPYLKTCDFIIHNSTKRWSSAELVSALNAAARCEPRLLGDGARFKSTSSASYPSSNPLSLSFPSPGTDVQPRLERFRLHMYGLPQTSGHHAVLERWKPTDVSRNLSTLQDSLQEELPKLDRPHFESVHNGKIDQKCLEKVKTLLDMIEVLDPINPEDVLCSNLHISLRNMSENEALLDIESPLTAQAKRILDKWEPTLKTALSRCRWIIYGGFAVTYISQDDPIRDSPQAFDRLIYGIPYLMSNYSPFLI